MFPYSRSSLAVGGAFLVAVGCTAQVSGPDDPPSKEPGPGSSQESTFTRTIVHLQADGTKTVETLQLPPRNQAPISNTLQPQACGVGQCGIQRDYGCSGASLQLFDQYVWTGNELCIYSSSPQGDFAGLDLGTVFRSWVCNPCGFLRCCVRGTWSGAIRSWQAGPASTYEFDSPNDYEQFGPGWGQSPADDIVSATTAVWITN
jgi:hypothetical protein